MRQLIHHESSMVSAGCAVELNCQNVTAAMLEYCSFSQLQLINQLFKDIILSDDMQGADSETLKAAMVAAIQSADFARC